MHLVFQGSQMNRKNSMYLQTCSEPVCGSRERVARSPVTQAVKSAPQDTCRMALPCRRSTLRGCRYEAWSPWPSWPTIFPPPWTLCRSRSRTSVIGPVCLHRRGICYSDRSSTVQQDRTQMIQYKYTNTQNRQCTSDELKRQLQIIYPPANR